MPYIFTYAYIYLKREKETRVLCLLLVQLFRPHGKSKPRSATLLKYLSDFYFYSIKWVFMSLKHFYKENIPLTEDLKYKFNLNVFSDQ